MPNWYKQSKKQDLKKKLVHLGDQKPQLRKHIRPVLDKVSQEQKRAKSDWLFANSIYRSQHKAIVAAIEAWMNPSVEEDGISKRELSELKEWVNQGVTKQTAGRGDGPSLSEMRSDISNAELKAILQDEFGMRVATSKSSVKDKLLRLGSERPNLRKHIKPVLDRLTKKAEMGSPVEALESELTRVKLNLAPPQDPTQKEILAIVKEAKKAAENGRFHVAAEKMRELDQTYSDAIKELLEMPGIKDKYVRYISEAIGKAKDMQ